MADILSGSTAHHVAAPLSSGQTIQICRHLADQTKQLQANVDSFRQDFDRLAGAVKGLRAGLNRTDQALQSAQDGLTESEKGAERTRKELGRSNSRLQALEMGFEKAGESYLALKERDQVTRSYVDALQVNTGQMQAWLTEIQTGLERNFNEDKSERGSLEQMSQSLERTLVRFGESLEEQKEAMAKANSGASVLRTDLERTISRVHGHDIRFVENSKAMHVVEKTLEETGALGSRLETQQKRMHAQVAEDSRNLQQLQSKAKWMEDTLGKTTGGLQVAQQDIVDAREVITCHSGKMRIAEKTAQRLDQESSARSDQLRSVQIRVEEANVVAHAVKEGLMQTNSIVLPNVLMDTAAAGALHGHSGLNGTLSSEPARSLPNSLSALSAAGGWAANSSRPATTPNRRRQPSGPMSARDGRWPN